MIASFIKTIIKRTYIHFYNLALNNSYHKFTKVNTPGSIKFKSAHITSTINKNKLYFYKYLH